MDKQLIKKYLKGQCTSEEAKKVVEWLQTPKGQQYLKEEIDQDIRVFNEFGEYFESQDVNSAQLFDRIQKNKSARSDNTFFKNIRNRNVGWRKAAAVVLLAGILSVLGGIYLTSSNTNRNTAQTQLEENISQTETVTTVVKTQTGERKEVSLPDGSKIVLRGNSSVEYLPTFKKRRVLLEGKAYFEIKKDKESPFKVYKGNSYIKVLGTIFVVKGNSSQGKIEVAVREGRVEVGKVSFGGKITNLEKLTSRNSGGEESKSIELAQHDIGWLFDNGSCYIERNTLNKEEGHAEGTSTIVFRTTSLKDVVQRLEERYDTQFVIQDKQIADKRLTSSFDDESLDEVLNILELSLDISYYKVDNKIYLSD